MIKKFIIAVISSLLLLVYSICLYFCFLNLDGYYDKRNVHEPTPSSFSDNVDPNIQTGIDISESYFRYFEENQNIYRDLIATVNLSLNDIDDSINYMQFLFNFLLALLIAEGIGVFTVGRNFKKQITSLINQADVLQKNLRELESQRNSLIVEIESIKNSTKLIKQDIKYFDRLLIINQIYNVLPELYNSVQDISLDALRSLIGQYKDKEIPIKYLIIHSIYNWTTISDDIAPESKKIILEFCDTVINEKDHDSIQIITNKISKNLNSRKK